MSFFKTIFNKFIYLLIYLWLSWVFVAAPGLSLVAASGGYSSLPCAGFSLWWLLLLWSTDSRQASFSSWGLQALEHRLNSYGAQAWLIRGMWDLPEPGLEPVSAALVGRFLITAPPGKPEGWCHFNRYECIHGRVCVRYCGGVVFPFVACFSRTEESCSNEFSMSFS